MAAASHVAHDHCLRISSMCERGTAQILGLVGCLKELETWARVVCNCRRIPGAQSKEKMRDRRRQIFQAHFNGVMTSAMYMIHNVTWMPYWLSGKRAISVVHNSCVSFSIKHQTRCIQVVTTMWWVSPEEVKDDMVEVQRNCVQQHHQVYCVKRLDIVTAETSDISIHIILYTSQNTCMKQYRLQHTGCWDHEGIQWVISHSFGDGAVSFFQCSVTSDCWMDYRKSIWPLQKMHHLFPKVLFQNKW